MRSSEYCVVDGTACGGIEIAEWAGRRADITRSKPPMSAGSYLVFSLR